MATIDDPSALTASGLVNDSARNRVSASTRPLMRAARYHQVGAPFSIDQVEIPVPRSTDVLVQIKACGIVPNLNYVIENLLRHPALHAPPLPATYGLDAAGVVVDKGSQVYGVDIGDRVYVNPMRYCGGCRHCRMGNVLACDYWIFAGYFGRGAKSQQMFEDYPYGGLAEYMTAPQYSVVHLPDNVSFETAARWGYWGTSYSALRHSNANMSSTVLVNGASGTLGLGAVVFALALGVPKILGVGRNAALLQKVKALSPDRIEILSTEDGVSVAAWARSLTGGHGAHIVIDALPTGAAPASLTAALAALGNCGCHVNIGGVYHDAPINFLDFMNKNQNMIGSFWFSTKEGQEMADLAGSRIVDLSCLEHHVFALEDVNTALATISGRNGGFSNYVISPDPEVRRLR